MHPRVDDVGIKRIDGMASRFVTRRPFPRFSFYAVSPLGQVDLAAQNGERAFTTAFVAGNDLAVLEFDQQIAFADRVEDPRRALGRRGEARLSHPRPAFMQEIGPLHLGEHPQPGHVERTVDDEHLVLAEAHLPDQQIEHVVGIDTASALAVSAKQGTGIEETLEAIVRLVPPPRGESEAPPKALIFDSWYDSYQGVVVMFRILEGTLRKGDEIMALPSGQTSRVARIVTFDPILKTKIFPLSEILEYFLELGSGAMNVPVPFSPALEDLTVPTPDGVVAQAKALCGRV